MINFDILKDLEAIQNPSKKETSKFSHSIHPYPAKYIPHIPNRIIREFTNERHVILDPFCGCGTTLLESKLLGRNSIGMDLNPIGVMISRVKTYTLKEDDIIFFHEFKIKLIESYKYTTHNLWVPEIPRLNHWFSEIAIIGLSKLISAIRNIENTDRRRILNLVLSSIIVLVSNQESETRYAAKENNISDIKILELFIKKYDDILKKLILSSNNNKFKTAESSIYLQNTKIIDQILPENSVDLIITSPPYLNSFDYYLYHKSRIQWLSYPENLDEVLPINIIQKNEIGSRYKYSGPNGDNIETFENDMKLCFGGLNKILKPSKLMFMVVGDSIVKGEFIHMDLYYEKMMLVCGFKQISKVSTPMSGASRSFIATNKNSIHFPNKKSHIMAFESVNLSKKPIEKILLPKTNDSGLETVNEVNELPSKILKNSKFFIKSNNVTSETHGLVKYPAKYIPHIPRWAITNFSQPGDLVIDPFNGSGTTALECLINDRDYIGIDINPIAILATKVKTTPLSLLKIQKNIENLKKNLANLETNAVNKIDFELQDFWFDSSALNKIFQIKSAIEFVKDKNIRNLMLISLSSIIKKVSYLDEGQLKVKRDAKKVLNGVPDPIQLFFKRLEKDATSISSLKPNSKAKINCFIGTATSIESILKNKDNSVDLIVTSPPYINAMNYPMYHRYELLLLGLINPKSYISHQADYIGTERVYAKDYKNFEPIVSENSNFDDLNLRLKEIHSKEPKRYYITKKYFEDMRVFLRGAYQVLKSSKKLIIVCGTNTIKGVAINTSYELSILAQDVGFKEITNFSYEIRKHRFKLTRHKTAGKINSDIVVILEK